MEDRKDHVKPTRNREPRDTSVKIRAGVIGLGIGEKHIEGYLSHPHCRVLGICDIDTEKLAEVNSRYKVPVVTNDPEEILKHPDIDVVSICSYDDVHAKQAMMAIENGKHVMIEKPICLFREEAEKIASMLKRTKKKMTSNLILRASPRFQKLKKMIESKVLGELFYVEGDYIHNILHKITDGWRGKMDFFCVTYGGGVHLIDLLMWFVNDDVVEVMSYGNNICSRDSNYGREDCIASILKFKNGCVGKVMTGFGCIQPHFHSVKVYGTRGTFINDYKDGQWYQNEHLEEMVPVKEAYPGYSKAMLLPNFVDAILRDEEPFISAEEVLRTIAVCFAVRESLESGKPSKPKNIRG